MSPYDRLYTFHGWTWTVLVVRDPDCVFAIRGSVPDLKGCFTDFQFFRDEKLSIPLNFTVGAWCHCLWQYAGCGSLGRRLQVSENEDGRLCLTISAFEDEGEGQSLQEENTGYIFYLDDEGEAASHIINALEPHHMYFTKVWLETFQQSPLAALDHCKMVKEVLEKLSSNDDILKFLGAFVTDQDFRNQHGRLLQIVYDEYEAFTVCQPVVEEMQDTGRLTGTCSSPLLMRENDSLLSSCSQTDGPSVGPSYSSAEEFLERSQPGPVPFEPEDSNTVVAEAFETQVDIRGDPDPLKSEDATTEHEENVAGGCISVGIEDVDLALDRDLEVLELKYGFEKILQKVMRRARDRALEVHMSSPPHTCVPTQINYVSVQVMSDEDDYKSASTESDEYRSPKPVHAH